MGLKYVDDYSFWTTQPGTFLSTGGATTSGGVYSVNLNGGGGTIASGLTAEDTYITNARMVLPTLPTGESYISAFQRTGNGLQCGCRIWNTGRMQFARFDPGAATMIGPLSTTAFTASVAFDVETKVVIGNSGTVEARVNGGPALPLTTVDNQAQAVNTADIALTPYSLSGSGGGPFNYEHLILMDGTGTACKDFIGPVNVEFLPPTGDGFYTDWSVTNPPNVRWQAVDDSDPDEDTTYIFDNVVSDSNTFTHGTVDTSTTSIVACAVWARARRDDATTRAFKIMLRLSGSDDLGSIEHFPGTSYNWFFQPYEVSPFSGIAWTVSNVNNVEYGVQVTT